LFAALTLFGLMVGSTKRLYLAALKAHLYQLVGIALLVVSAAVLSFSANSTSAYFVFFCAVVFLLPIVPAHTYLSGLFAEIEASAGIGTLIFQFSVFFVFIKYSAGIFVEPATETGIGIALPMLSLFILAIAAKAQDEMRRLFSYLVCFFASLIALAVSLSLSANANSANEAGLAGAKFLAIATPVLLTYFWLIFVAVGRLRQGYLIEDFRGALQNRKLLAVLFLLGAFLALGFPLTPVFQGLLAVAISVFKNNLNLHFLFIPVNAKFLLFCLLLAFLLNAYWLLSFSRTLFAASEEDKAENKTQQTIPETEKLSRRQKIIFTALLILLSILSILPAYFFALVKESAKMCGKSAVVQTSKTPEAQIKILSKKE